MAALQAVKQFRLREVAPRLKSASSSEAAGLVKIPNPFLPHRNPESGRWAPPKYSLRLQAELIKHAQASGTLHLLPPGPKAGPRELERLKLSAQAVPSLVAGLARSERAQDADAASPAAQIARQAGEGELWNAPVEWEGVPHETAADGVVRLYAKRKRMFKGHKWERTKQKREEERKVAMEHMQTNIERFRSTYRRKLPNPLTVPRTTSYTKLPF
ncbi:hypothetical protein CERSUDRAFT_85546 [Gelatoporia subvermispora B]|uniref:Large ribosomal subunit protein mL59 domain-containing protein n=1 Tax=Ceriporiopsis subvermispora (strain B) TaxID=914234 RepID=M2R9Z8_CERS8|nr:hypothetical protein CERSUDRAFT_85546 [Gelatoporia subvermispora B]